MQNRRSVMIQMAAATAVGLCVPAGAAAAGDGVFQAWGAALGGIDPVGYFTESAAVAGSREHALVWHGALWLFASQRSRDLFEMNPRGYAPRFGGHCAMKMTQGLFVAPDPAAWTIHEDRLYLAASLALRDVWRRDIPGHVAIAQDHWQRLVAG